MRKTITTFAAALLALASIESNATLIGFDSGDASNAASFAVTTDGGNDPTTWGPGDWFGWGAASAWPQASGMPFSMADDSVVGISGSAFAGDTQGIIDSRNIDNSVFGATDTVNGSNSGGGATATWVFDISAASDLMVSIDIAAMGDFEASSDSFLFSYSIDGGPIQTLFEVLIDEAIAQNYTMESGTLVTLNDPATLTGVLLNDEFATFTAPLSGSGSLLSLAFTASTDGGSEAFIFDNLRIDGELPEPGVLALCLLGAVGLAGRRRLRG